MKESTAYNMDCMEGMKQYPDKYFELAIVDPPYGIGVTWRKNRKGEKNFKGQYKNEAAPGSNYFKQLRRVSKNQIIWGANYYPYVWPTKNVIVWDKVCTWEKDHKGEAEIAVTTINQRPISVFRHNWSGGRKLYETGISIIHPHQKPVALYRWLLQNYAKPGDKILDTHLGSGSSRIAAYDMGFDFVGYEIDADYFAAQEERFARHTAQVRLGDIEPEDKPEQMSMLFAKEEAR